MKLQHILRPGLGQLGTHPPLPLGNVSKPHLSRLDSGALPKISIVVPSYNQGRYLGDTLRSIIDQKYPNLELILVDGASTDTTLDVIRQYEDHLTWWVSEPDGGQTEAINKGFRKSTGEIMAWINSDDLMADGALHRVASHFLDNRDVDVVYGNRILIDEDGAEIGRWLIPFHSDRVLKWADFVPQETLYWRRSAWNAIGCQLDTSFRFAMDWDFLLRLSDAQVRFEHLPHFLGLFRIHGQQKTSSQMNSIGAREIGLLRKRATGRDTSRGELLWNLVPFLLSSRWLELRAKLGQTLGRSFSRGGV